MTSVGTVLADRIGGAGRSACKGAVLQSSLSRHCPQIDFSTRPSGSQGWPLWQEGCINEGRSAAQGHLSIEALYNFEQEVGAMQERNELPEACGIADISTLTGASEVTTSVGGDLLSGLDVQSQARSLSL